VDRTDNGRVGRRHLLEGTALEHELLPTCGFPELGPEAELLVEMNDLADRLLLRVEPLDATAQRLSQRRSCRRVRPRHGT
jgi:hypothetical protein